MKIHEMFGRQAEKMQEIQEAPDGNQESDKRTEVDAAESYSPVLHSGNALPGPALVSGGQVDGGRPD